MASSHSIIPILSLLLFTTLSTTSAATVPRQFLLPIAKDGDKPQYYTTFQIGTPLTRLFLSVDLSNPWSWFTCSVVGFNTTSYSFFPNSSSYRPVPCTPTNAAAYASHFCFDCLSDTPGCAPVNHTCGAEPFGPYFYTHQVQGHPVAGLLLDVITLFSQGQNGNSNGQLVKSTLPKFPFTCSYIDVLKGLSRYTKGILSLARKGNTLHALVSKSFGVPHKFALCLPSLNQSIFGVNGAMFFGGGPYHLAPNKALDLSNFLVTTPLVVNPVDTAPTFYKGNVSVDYFIQVRSIKVDGTPARFDSSLLLINKAGNGGTKISTIDPYTILHTQIYKALTETFVAKAAAMNITRAAPVSPFGVCFDSKTIKNTGTGPGVPIIDLILEGKSSVLHDKNASWRFYGANSMVKVSKNVMCLGFVDGGVKVRTSIVIGGKQMEDNLVEFDLQSSKLGITSSLLRFGTTCSQFKGV